MRRFALLLIVPLVVACKKPPKQEEPDPPPGPPKVGHSVTKLRGSGETADGSGSATGSSGGREPDAGLGSGMVVGGNGSPAFRDGQGRVHGPGGPVYMGRGIDCDDAHDHCLRPDVWFSIANIIPGRLFRALPVFTLEDKWWTWRGEPDEPVKLYKTKLAGSTPLTPGTPVIWFSSETSSRKWADSEYDALTSSRWEAGVVDAPSAGGHVRIQGFGDADMDTVRIITEVRSP